jgi:hypothetical protein
MIKSILISLILIVGFSGCQLQNQNLDIPKTKSKIFESDSWKPINKKNVGVVKNG